LHDLIKARFFDFLLRDKRFDGYFNIIHRPLQRLITPFRIQKMQGFLLRIPPYQAEEAIQVTQYIKAIQATKAILRFIEDIQASLQFIERTKATDRAAQVIQTIKVTQATEKATQDIQTILRFIKRTQAVQNILQIIEDVQAILQLIKDTQAAEKAIPVIKTILRFIKRTQAIKATQAIKVTQATKAAKDTLQSIEATQAAKQETQAIQVILRFIKDTKAAKEATQTIHVAQLTSLSLISNFTLFIPFLDLVSIMRLMSVCKYLHIFNIMNKIYKMTRPLFNKQSQLRFGDLFTLIQDSAPRKYIKQLVLDVIRNDPKAISICDFEENQTWSSCPFVDEKHSVLVSSRSTVYNSIVELLDQYQSFATLLIFQDTTFELAWRKTSFTVVNFSSLVYLFLERCKIGYFGNLKLKSDTLKMIELLYNEFSLSEGWPSRIICPKDLEHLVIKHKNDSSFCIEVYESTEVE
jgi:hypothetical protein